MSISIRTLIAATVIALVAASGLSIAQERKIYWSASVYDGDDLFQRSDLDGSNIETMIPVLASGIAVDPAGGKLYWAQFQEDQDPAGVWRANLDGTSPEFRYDLAGLEPWGLAIDREHGWIFVSLSFFEGCIGIYRFSLHGSGDQGDGVNIADGRCVSGLEVDPCARKIYWAEGWPEKGILRANYDGSGLETVVDSSGDGANPAGVALDLDGGKIYWTQREVGLVRRADLDGSNVETVVAGGVNYTWGIALDLVADKVYWGVDSSGSENDAIHRADLDGSNQEAVVPTRARGEIAITPVPHDCPDVPAASAYGLAVLLLAMLGASAWLGVKS